MVDEGEFCIVIKRERKFLITFYAIPGRIQIRPDPYLFGSSRIPIRKSGLRIRIRKNPDPRIRILKKYSRIRNTAKWVLLDPDPECDIWQTKLTKKISFYPPHQIIAYIVLPKSMHNASDELHQYYTVLVPIEICWNKRILFLYYLFITQPLVSGPPPRPLTARGGPDRAVHGADLPERGRRSPLPPQRVRWQEPTDGHARLR